MCMEHRSEKSKQIPEVAAHDEVTPEELPGIVVEELLTRPDESFQQAMSYVVKKNAQLYRQLT